MLSYIWRRAYVGLVLQYLSSNVVWIILEILFCKGYSRDYNKNRKQEIRRKNDLIKCIDCTKKEENNTLVTTNLNCSVAEGDNIKNKRKEEEKR